MWFEILAHIYLRAPTPNCMERRRPSATAHDENTSKTSATNVPDVATLPALDSDCAKFNQASGRPGTCDSRCLSAALARRLLTILFRMGHSVQEIWQRFLQFRAESIYTLMVLHRRSHTHWGPHQRWNVALGSCFAHSFATLANCSNHVWRLTSLKICFF